MTDSQIAVSRIRVERDEDDPCTFLSNNSHQFRKLDVVADQNGDRTAVGIEDTDFSPGGHAPPFTLAGCDVYLFLPLQSSITPKQIRNVVQAFVFDHEQ